jgi:DNA ligase-1
MQEIDSLIREAETAMRNDDLGKLLTQALARKPMKAPKLKQLTDLRLPTWAQPKFDGIRGRVIGGQMLSNSWKLIRNGHLQDLVGGLPEGLDGELVTGLHFHDTQSGLMSGDGRPDVQYMVFDLFDRPDLPYRDRMARLQELSLPPWCTVVESYPVMSVDQILKLEEQILSQGHEGLMFRDPDSAYKFGRATMRDQALVKWKHFEDSEAMVLGFEEASTNINPIVPNAYGMAKRPGGGPKLPKGTLGSFLARDIVSGVEFSCGTGKGLTQDLRQHIWDNQTLYLGKIFTYRFQPIGVREKPRVPSWQGWRDE